MILALLELHNVTGIAEIALASDVTMVCAQ